MFTNINILGKKDKYNYIVEYIPTNEVYSMENTDQRSKYEYLKPDQFLINDKNTNFDDIVLVEGDNNYLRHYNDWFYINDEDFIKNDQYLPQQYKRSIVRLYFPQHSMESYGFTDKYAITINTWIAGKPIVLKSSIVDRSEALACDDDKIFMNQHYFEYIDFNIIDPIDLIYDDNWRDFRHYICNETILNDEYNLSLNNTGSLLYIIIDPVIKYSSNKFIKSNDFYGGQGSINYSSNNNELKLLLTHNCFESYKNNEPKFDCNLSFNEIYEHNFNQYLNETYLFDPTESYSIKYTIIIGNEQNLYTIKTSEYIENTYYSFLIKDIIRDNFENWTGFKEGIYISCSAEIYKNGKSVINLISNKIPLTKELYKFFVKDSGFKELHYIELKDIDMNIHNIQVFNRIETSTSSGQPQIQNQTSINTKSNIIHPVFYRAVESSNIIIHKDVTEMICINLDIYKSKVTSFIIQIEGIQIAEYGRTSAGILFKIIGSKLPGKIKSGHYYILNQDSEMVTSGKYTYV